MDQDFHYYGTYYAATQGGFNKNEATLIAKAANFIDFFSEKEYDTPWKLVSDTRKSNNYNIVAKLDYLRHTFQGDLFSSLLSPQDGLWCSYHFIPGNYYDLPNTPSRERVHGRDVADFLPKFEQRDVTKGMSELETYRERQAAKYLNDLKHGNLLTRPQSPLSRQLIMDAILCATNDARLESILGYAIGGQHILKNNREDNLRRFKLILLGIRAHVIADTWAHQDFCGLDNVMNTYWDVNYEPDASFWSKLWDGAYGRQSINYDDGTSTWKNKVLSVITKLSNSNFEAAPNATSYLGHGWMGHLPDFSFVKFRYKPCWADPREKAIERNNPEEYKRAWVELVSLFTQAKGGQLKLDTQFQNALDNAIKAIQKPFNLEGNGTGRKSSAKAWQNVFVDLPLTNIDVDPEPDSHAVLDGMVEKTDRLDPHSTSYININSDLYLFQIAADYHFHFVKDYLQCHGIYEFTGSWSKQTSALSLNVAELFDDGTDERYSIAHSLSQESNKKFSEGIFTGECGENSFATSEYGLQINCTVKLNGDTALGNCIKAKKGGCVHKIELRRSGSWFSDYVLNVDAQGPKGFGSGFMYLYFTDESNDTYTLKIFDSDRKMHTLKYSSKKPAIKKIRWSN